MSEKRFGIEYIRLIQVGPFRDTRVPFCPVTCLVGKNGTGKSTVLQALAAPNKSAYLKANGWDANASRLTMRAREHPDNREYAAAVPHSGMLEDNTFTIDRIAEDYVSLFQNAVLYDFRSPSVPEAGPIGVGNRLEPTCSNLVSVIDAMRDQDDGSFDLLEEFIRRLVPPITGISLSAAGQGQKIITAKHPGNVFVPFRQLSTGTRYLIALGAILAEKATTRILLIEEPEIGLHPGIIGDVVRALTSLVEEESTTIEQVIITTHSPYVYWQLRERPERIVVLEHKNGQLLAKPLNEMEDWEKIFTDDDFLNRTIPARFTDMDFHPSILPKG